MGGPIGIYAPRLQPFTPQRLKGLAGVFGPPQARAAFCVYVAQHLTPFLLIDAGYGFMRCARGLGAKVYKLGYNACLNPFPLTGPDDAASLATLAKAALRVGEGGGRLLHQALLRLYAHGSTLSLRDVHDLVEAQATSMGLYSKEQVDRLLFTLESMTVGRAGAVFGGPQPSLDGSAVVELPQELPWPLRVYAVGLALMTLTKNYRLIALEGCDVLLSKSARARDEAVVERAAFFTDLIMGLANRGVVVLLCSPSPSDLDVSTQTAAYCGMDAEGFKLTPQEVLVKDGRGLYLLRVSELKPLSDAEAGVEEVLKPVTLKLETQLEVLLGGLAKPASEVLAFLRDRASQREDLITFIMHRLNVDAAKAVSVLQRLLAKGLVAERVGTDGAYYVACTPYGLQVLLEYELSGRKSGA